MKRLLFASISVLALLLAGCASFPEKKTNDDCLVVIKVRASNPDDLRWVRQYSFTLEPEYPAVTIPATGQDIVFVVREPSVRVIRVTSRIIDGSFAGPASNRPLNLILPYDPGHAVVADFVVVRRLEKTGTNSFREYFDFGAATEDDKNAALSELRKNPQFAPWDTQ